MNKNNAVSKETTENPRNVETFRTDWQGIMLEISFERLWLNSERMPYSHLQIRTIAPERQPLPITRTGYLSHFTTPDIVDTDGGPVAFFMHWLDHAAQSPAWRKYDMERRQLSLF